MDREPRSGCPINPAVEAFGDRWSLLVLRDMMFGGRRYFRELLAGDQEGIASNILADRLQRLVASGLLTRDDAGRGRRADLQPDRAGHPARAGLRPARRVGPAAPPATDEPLRVRAELLESGGPELWAAFMAELRAVHLGAPAPDGPSATERLAAAYAQALGQTAVS